jgi:hypothetical protein
MAINNIATGVRNAMADAFVDAIDTGTTDTGGDIAIFTAAFGTLLAEPEFGNPAFGAAASGVATANAISDDPSAANTGTAAVLRLRDRDNATVAEGTVSTAGADLNLNTVSITSGDIVAITAATITQPAS